MFGKTGRFDEISSLSESPYAERPIGDGRKAKDRKMDDFNEHDHLCWRSQLRETLNKSSLKSIVLFGPKSNLEGGANLLQVSAGRKLDFGPKRTIDFKDDLFSVSLGCHGYLLQRGVKTNSSSGMRRFCAPEIGCERNKTRPSDEKRSDGM